MDCARTAWRLGAESVRVLYRRSPKEMLITPGELEELKHEGISMEFMISPAEYLGDAQGRLRAVKFIKNELGDPDESGRRRPVPVIGSEFELEADSVLLATGQFPDTGWIDGTLRERIVDEEENMVHAGEGRTADEKIFMAGDFSQGASSLIRAIGHAKKTARAVDHFLTGQDRLRDVVRVEDAPATGRIREMDAVPLTAMPSLEVKARDLKGEVEKGYTQELAAEETQRCYLCHYKFEIDHDRCIYCDWCVKAKPRPNCILKVKELIRDPQGRTVDFEIAKTSEETRFIYINQEDCIRCHACVQACPVNCISVQKVSQVTVPCGGKPVF
jgi:NADPH-dependent glutamate synthase beta subunit-like oxidoreductase